MPPRMIGPTGCSRYSNSVTMPKLPPPPRSPQNSSGFSCSLAVTKRPSAVTRSAESRLSQVRPCSRSSQPLPLPRVRPARPVVVTRPPVVASPNACVSRSNSPQFTPAWARARRATGIHPDALHRRQIDDQPAVDAARGRPPSGRRRARRSAALAARANSSAARMSAAPVTCAITRRLARVVHAVEQRLGALVAIAVRAGQQLAPEPRLQGVRSMVWLMGILAGRSAADTTPAPAGRITKTSSRAGTRDIP